MSSEPTNADRIRHLPYVLAFDSLNAAFCSLSILGSIFVLFLSELGLPKDRVGFLLSLICFMSVIALVMAPLAARWGVKRVFLTAWTIRNGFALMMLATPWVFHTFGLNTTFYFITVVLACFCVCRSIGEAANYPWRQEMIPHTIRGKFIAVSSTLSLLTTVAVLFIAGLVLKPAEFLRPLLPEETISRYMVLLAMGAVAGIASVMAGSRIPGGAPTNKPEPVRIHLAKMKRVFRDRNFLNYMLAVSLVSLGSAPLGAFVPLYLKEQIHLAPATVVMLQNGAMVGSMCSSFFWGWAADRYGSKPVLITGLCMMFLPPIGWMLIPHAGLASIVVALIIYVAAGTAGMAYGIGVSRQLYVGLVPPNRRTQYMSVFVAWSGLTQGIAQLMAGKSTTAFGHFSGHFLFLEINAFTPLFIFSVAMLLVGLVLQQKVDADSRMPVRRFMGMFLQGNPLMAVESLVRYSLAGREADRLPIISRMGASRSPLGIEELIDALEDPSFNVRYEAIVAIARTRRDPRLTEALIETLISGQPDLSMTAAWALSRLGDKAAVPPLRWTFTAGYPLLRARSARALATLGDATIVPELEKQLSEGDAALRPIFAAALETLRRHGGANPAEIAARPVDVKLDENSLLKALGDGDFNVRYEAIILASHERPSLRLTEAMADLLANGEPDLSIEAAWALARMGDPAAVEPLRQAFASGFPLLRARCARALGRFGESEIIPELIRGLGNDTPLGIRIAYASALGQLRARQAVGHLLALRAQMPNQTWLSELDLALARLAGDERQFFRLWRQMRKDPGTVAAQTLRKLRRGICHRHRSGAAAEGAVDQCIQRIGRDEFVAGATALAGLIDDLDLEALGKVRAAILKDGTARLRGHRREQLDVLPLILHCLHAGIGR
ncbi:MAG: MFS transporter [Phycisphaerae bacterium]|jgi:HEAT repeat protein/Na+/melibiose symporter-like transporter